MKKAPLGQQQLEVLHYVTDHAPVTAAQVVAHFAARHNLARTTILTVMDRLCHKGYLTRAKVGNVYHYQPSAPKAQMLTSIVDDFVERVLGGSPRVLMVYLAQKADLSDEEWSDLKQLVHDLDAQREDEKFTHDQGATKPREEGL
jgi:predicted transcriptional regulator